MEQRIFTNFSSGNFTQIKNSAAKDKSLSWKARGILVYLASLPSDWKIYKNEIMKHSTDKRDSFNSGWNELKKAGYIKGVQIKENGKFKSYIWYVCDDRSFEIPEVDFPVSGNPNSGKTPSTNTNNTNTNNTNTIDTEIDTKELFLKVFNRLFLTKQTVSLFLNFGNELECKDYLDIIFKTKAVVEKEINKQNKGYKITGETWSKEIEKEAYRFIFKKKEGEHKSKEIQNLKGYWYTTMKTFWENVFVMEKEYGSSYLHELFLEDKLELEDIFFESKTYFSNEKEWRKNRKDFIYEGSNVK
ncbi:hypothetical protein [Enterococcus malodoratus]|uniref:DnaD domain-containing protein n=1 Tax=Enterococcus malodoratus ATCC 43197 TaxID=1158601 RepID=R2P2B6_9ENTE|nr:hypothetical protein [Enterococcus malodoratus]EOH78407.1 hypothetical protein UAI_01716 [Enterococcus malodoratus ATCC 43197]EOT64505.1 hypothetical protein I585_03705 [Enterococcus malodoratus ATCC 43197]OJG63800.1 hypothetical protein RV07_GL000906 [Enterococcus malodoratus]SPW92749.1 Uncharacterised protein [Enterococcus malodoratus]STC72843.1 Uncharacterised protein [Enterococcus malodoratus]